METVRYWPPILILIFLVGGLFGFRYLEQVDVANTGLEDIKLALKQTKESLESRKEMQAIVDTAAQNLAKSQQKQKEADRIQDEADKKQRLIEGDLRYTITSLRTSVEKIRNDAVGVELPEVALLSGSTLKNAKIRKVDDASISFFHSIGISAVPLDQLPSDLVEKYDMGPNSLVSRLEKLEASTGNNAAPVKTEAGESPELVAVRRRIAHLEIQINSATAHKDKLEAEVINQDIQIKAAEAKGSFTFNMRTMRDVAEGNAGTARSELKLLKSELEKQKVLEANLTKK